MKKTLLASIALLASVLFVSAIYAQDEPLTRLNLPEGALARLRVRATER